jgi:uncharacterized protein (DUF2237 family)
LGDAPGRHDEPVPAIQSVAGLSWGARQAACAPRWSQAKRARMAASFGMALSARCDPDKRADEELALAE